MDTADVVKRILNLKKMSVELKESTENKESMDLNFVKGIIKSGKNESIDETSFQQPSTERKEKKEKNENVNGVLSHLVNI